MIVEQHYDEEVIITLLEEAEQAAARDSHVPACPSCADTLDSFRTLTSSLSDGSVWDERELSDKPAPQTFAALRSFATNKALEDAAAAPRVKKLLAASAEERVNLLRQHPEWRTAGLVRKLLAAVDEVNFSAPKDAEEITALAADVAELLDVAKYPTDLVMTLRATAWRERAFALYSIGSYRESLSALDQVTERLAAVKVAEFDRARADVVRSYVLRDLEHLEESIALARSASIVFVRWSDQKRYAAAENAQAGSLFVARRFDESADIHVRIAQMTGVDDTTRASALNNAANCYRELGRFEDAKSLFVQALEEFERLGLSTFRARTRWSLAKIFVQERRYDQALALLTELRQDFREFGMPQDVALVSIDMAEALLVQERPAEVAELCREAMEYFRHAGLAYTEGALTALAFLREAADRRTLTLMAVKNVRAFFEVLPKQPNLLFASFD
jgi:tetratricopeptide (TPR) repeat protein